MPSVLMHLLFSPRPITYDPILALLIGMLFTGLVAYGVGAPVLRLKGYYLAIATLGFGLIIQSCLVTFASYTGGPDGFRDIVPLRMAGYVFKTDEQYYYPIWTAAMLILLLTRNIARSKIGRAMLALRGDDVAASAMGVNIARYKIQAFVLVGRVCFSGGESLRPLQSIHLAADGRSFHGLWR